MKSLLPSSRLPRWALLAAALCPGTCLPGTAVAEDATAAPQENDADIGREVAAALGSHWAFVTPVRCAPSAGPAADGDGARQSSAIDRLVAGKILAAGLHPSPEASPRTLVRRLWFDLTGLPPPADEADAYANDPGEERYGALVDRLLASREHAEHWARKWLDLARYADTMGYALDNQDNRYPFAWTYRDWVIGALERDLPYDRFVTLQLAADLVAPPVPRTELAALGFLAVGRSFLGNKHDIIDDRIDLVTRGLMGLTIACARCHDHKYEPVGTTDYYALHGIFSSCRVPDELPVIGEPAPAAAAEAFAAKRRLLEQAVADHEAAVHARATREAFEHAADYFFETARPTPRGADGRPPRLADGYEMEQLILDRLARQLAGRKPEHPVLGPWNALRGVSDGEFPAAVEAVIGSWRKADWINGIVRAAFESARPQSLRDLSNLYAQLAMRVAPESAGGPQPAGDEPADLDALRRIFGREGTPFVAPRADAMRLATRAEQTEHRKRTRAITAHDAEAPGGPPRAMVLVDDGKPVDSPVFLRGNPAAPGDRVGRRLPLLLGGTPVARESSGRLDLAAAIVSAANPLTARMIVNWAWLHHFGAPLVDPPDDFGLHGEPPSNQELLDDLAVRFVEEGHWSLRWLHREIVTSRTWRQSSVQREELVARDPENRLFARANRRRLDWEAWRDSLLAAAGTLDRPQRGGPGVDPLAAGSMHVRTIYGRLDRQNVPGIMRAFDIANPDTAVHVRPLTAVPQQGLAVLNAPLVVEAARRVADRIDREAGPDAGDDVRIDRLWRAVLSRSPSAEERAAARDWLEAEARADVEADRDGKSAACNAPVRLAHALLATAEFQFVD